MALPKGAGSLNERIQISRIEKIRHDTGRYSENIIEIGEFFAQVNVVSAHDNVIADQERDLRTHEVILRLGTADIQQGDIITWRNTKIDVRTTRPYGAWLILDCVTRSE